MIIYYLYSMLYNLKCTRVLYSERFFISVVNFLKIRMYICFAISNSGLLKRQLKRVQFLHDGTTRMYIIINNVIYKINIRYLNRE